MGSIIEIERRLSGSPLKQAILGSLFALVLVALPFCNEARSEEEKRWGLNANVGIVFDDNVNTDEIDNNAGAGDKSATFDLGATYDVYKGKSVSVELGYDFSQTFYETLSDFDFHSHGGSIFAETELSGNDLTAYYGYTRAYLGGKDFIGLHIFQPSVGRLFGDHWYVSLSPGYQNKHLISAEERDANLFSGDVTAYYFFNESKSYVSLGYRIEDENAAAAEFDYLGQYLKFNFKTPLAVNLLEKQPTVRIGYEFSFKDYKDVTAEIGDERLDKRHTLNAGFDLPVTDIAGFRFNFERISSISNLQSSDFTERIYSLSVFLEL